MVGGGTTMMKMKMKMKPTPSLGVHAMFPMILAPLILRNFRNAALAG